MLTIFNGRSLSFDSNKPVVYAQMSIEFLKHLHLFKGARLSVLMCLFLHSNSEGYSWPSIATITKETGFQEDAVHSALNKLCQVRINGRRVLSREQQRNEDGHFNRNVYRLFPESETQGDYPTDPTLDENEYGFSKESKNTPNPRKSPAPENTGTVKNRHGKKPTPENQGTNYIHDLNNIHLTNDNHKKTILSFSHEKANEEVIASDLVPESNLFQAMSATANQSEFQSDNDSSENFPSDPFSDSEWQFWEQEVLKDNPPEDLFTIDTVNEVLTSLSELSQTKNISEREPQPINTQASFKCRMPQENYQGRPKPQLLFQELSEAELTPAKAKSNTKSAAVKSKAIQEPEASPLPGHKELMQFLHTEIGPYRDGGRQAKEVHWLLNSGFTIEECKNCLLHLKLTWQFGRISWIQVAEHIASWKARRSQGYQEQKQTFQEQPEQRKKPKLAI